MGASDKLRKQIELYTGFEIGMALFVTASAVSWLGIQYANAGALWRDEILSLNVASLSSLKSLWQNLSSDSCPILWHLLLRSWESLGFTSDLQLRILGLLIGLSVLGGIWLVERWFGNGCPTVCLALLWFSPTILYSVTTLRAYGIGILASIVVFGLAWLAALNPSGTRLCLLLIASMLMVHTLWINAVLVLTFIVSGGAILARRKRWRDMARMLGIGAIAAISLLPYWAIVRANSQGIQVFTPPVEQMPTFWSMINNAISSAGIIHGMLWVILGALAVIAGVRRAIGKKFLQSSCYYTDLNLYSSICLILGTALYLLFYHRLHVITPHWYYAGLMVLAALCIENLLFTRPASAATMILRITLAGVLCLSAFPDVWVEVHTRRTNVDLIARTLRSNAADEDLILISPFYCGTTFDRYYSGNAKWITVPKTEPRFGGGFDHVLKKMGRTDAMNDVLEAADLTIRAGRRLWVVSQSVPGGQGPSIRPIDPLTDMAHPPLPPFGDKGSYYRPHENYWKMQISVFLGSQDLREYRPAPVAPETLINPYELLMVSMYQKVISSSVR